MRASVIGSSVVHLALLAVLFYARSPVSLVVPGPETVQVALVDPSALTPVAPATPEPEPTPPKIETVKPVDDVGVKLAPEPPKKKKKVEKKPDEPPPLQTDLPALPSATVGSAGLKGDMTLEVKDFAFTYYLVLVRNRIAANWAPPAGVATGGQRVRSVVYFRIARGGEVSDARLEERSDLEFFDRSALRAVMLSDPLPPLPLGFTGGELAVHFGFDWEAP